jgi:hypothetical protein
MSEPGRRPTVAQERAAVQARQKAERAARRAELATAAPTEIEGRVLIVASWIGTAIFTISALYSATIGYDAHRSPPGDLSGTLIAMGMFAVGCALFCAALFLGAQRSRDAEMGVGGWFLLIGSAPRPAQLHLLGSLGVEITVAIATAAARPFSTLAFGILAPVYGLALCGIWGARYGTFPPRQVETRESRR